MNPDGLEKGYIKLFRKLRNNPLWKQRRKFSFAEAWIDLLFMANHEKSKTTIGFETIRLSIGDLITSQEKLAIAWHWDRGRVKRFLKMLQSEQQIVLKPTTKYTKISICNYKEYADWRPANTATNEQRVNNERTTSEHREEVKEVKECKEVKKDMSSPSSQYKPQPTPEPIILSAEESQCWTILESIENFPLKNQARVAKLQEYIEKFSEVDPVKLCENFAANKIDKPIADKGNPLAQLRRFFVNAKEWGQSLREKPESKHSKELSPPPKRSDWKAGDDQESKKRGDSAAQKEVERTKKVIAGLRTGERGEPSHISSALTEIKETIRLAAEKAED